MPGEVIGSVRGTRPRQSRLVPAERTFQRTLRASRASPFRFALPLDGAKSLRHWNRFSLTCAALGKPKRIARRFDSGRCFEPFLEHGNTCLISVDGQGGDGAAAVFGNEKFAIRCTHAIGSLDLLGPPDIDRLARLSR